MAPHTGERLTRAFHLTNKKTKYKLMKSSVPQATHRGMLSTLRDSPEEKSGQAIWPLKDKF